MRTRVYRNYTFTAVTECGNELVMRSDNFFTVESNITAMLKDEIAAGNSGIEGLEYIIYQVSKDGKWRRPIERIYTRKHDDAIYIDMVPDEVVNEEAVVATEEVVEEKPKKTKKTNKK